MELGMGQFKDVTKGEAESKQQLWYNLECSWVHKVCQVYGID